MDPFEAHARRIPHWWNLLRHKLRDSKDERLPDPHMPPEAFELELATFNKSIKNVSNDKSTKMESAFKDKPTQNESALLIGIENMLRLLAVQGIEPAHKTPFLGRKVPSMDLSNYLKRLHTFFHCSDACFVVAFIYICRITGGRSPCWNGIPVHPRSYHRLFVTGLTVAAKYWEDIKYTNSVFAEVGGLKTEELNRLETLFVQQLNWKLTVSTEEYDLYYQLIWNATNASRSVMN